jgi:hypothetical protein
LGLAVIAVSFVLLVLLTGAQAGEDAYIAFRYAENLAAGGELAFNPGERPCEGFSSPIWVLLLAGADVVTGAVPRVAQILGVVFAVATILLSYLTARRIGVQSVWFAPLLVALNADWAFHSTFGLETTLYACVVLLCVNETVRTVDSARISTLTLLSFLLLLLTRPEGIAVGLSIILGGALCKPMTRQQLRQLLVLTGVLLGMFLVFLLWRYMVFGALLSNTATVKLLKEYSGLLERGQAGLRYVVAFAICNPTLALAAVLAPLSAVLRKGKTGLPVASMATAGVLASVVFEGGDRFYFHHWRFLVPLTPLVAVQLAALLDRLRSRLQPRWGSWLVGITLVVLSFHLPRVYLDQGYQRYVEPSGSPLALGVLNDRISSLDELKKQLAAYPEALSDPGSLERRVGLWLGANISGDLLLATGQAGQIPYHSGLRTFDINGLVTCEVAHAQNEEQVSVQAGADLFLLYDQELPRYNQLLLESGYRFAKTFGIRNRASAATGGVARFYLFTTRKELRCKAGEDERLVPEHLPEACEVLFDIP